MTNLATEMDLQLPLMFWILTWKSIEPYNIKFNDCRKPSQIFKYQTNALCKDAELTPKQETTMTVLQKVKNKKLTGYSCQVVVTRWWYYCGVYAHAKIAAIPEVEVNEGLSTSSCSDLINRQKFISKDGQSWKLEMNTETIVRVAETGQIEDKNDQVQCKGQATRIGGNIIDNIIVLSQSKVTIKEEKFIVDGTNVEVVADHLILDCKLSSGGCRTLEKTYIWAAHKDDCPLRKVRTLQMTEDIGYWVDEKNSVVLKKLGPVAAPSGCASVILHNTEYEDLYLTEEDTGFETLQDEMQLSIYIAARDDFIMFEAERKVDRLRRRFQKNLCSQQFSPGTEGEIVRIDNENNFALTSGETTYVFNCPEQTDKIRETGKCYVDIPIGETDDSFVTPVTRVFTRNSRVKPCNSHFPTTVKTEQSWIELRPMPTPISDPAEMPLDDHVNSHLDVASGGLYTPSEVKAWEHHLESSNFQRSVLHKISNGLWLSDNSLSVDEPGYTLDNLLIPTPLGWFDDLMEKVEKYTAHLCVAVLLIESLKFVSTISMLGMALIREGIAGLVAVLTMLICPAQQTLAKMRRRAKRNRSTSSPLIAKPDPENADGENAEEEL